MSNTLPLRHFDIPLLSRPTRKGFPFPFSGRKLCSESGKCRKNDPNGGKCNSGRTVNPFWIRSPIQVGHSIKREARNGAAQLEEECERKKARIDEQEASVNVREVEVTER